MEDNSTTLPQSFLDRTNKSYDFRETLSKQTDVSEVQLPQSFLDKTKDPSRINYMDDVSTSVNEEATELKINEQTKHYKELNQDAVELLKTEPQTYDSIRTNTEIQGAAVRMAEEYLGRENIRPEDALEEVLEHFNKFDVNELTAAYDFGYVSGLVSDIERAEEEGLDRKLQQKTQALNDYRLLFTAKNALPYFWQEGGRGAFTAVGDVLEGIVKSPSTWIGMLLPVVGKVAATGSAQASKFAVTKLLQQVGKRQIATAVAVEGTAGALQDVASQKTQIEADLRKDYSLLQTGAVTAVSGLAPAALVPLTAKGGLIAFMERNTGDIVAANNKAVQEQLQAGTEAATKVTTSKANKKIVDNLKTKLRPLDEEAVKRGLSIKDEIAERAGLEETFQISIKSEKYEPVLAALVDITKVARKGMTKAELDELDGARISEIVHKAIQKMSTKADDVAGVENALGKQFDPILEKYNLTRNDFADVFLADASEAARVLAQRGKLKKMMSYITDAANYNYFGFTKETQDAFRKVGGVGDDSAKNVRDFTQGGVARELDAARLAFMTSQPATTLRNVVGGLLRLPVDGATRVIDTTLQKITGVERLTPNSDAWAVFNGFLNSKETKALQQIFEQNFQEQYQKVFRPLIDTLDASKTKNKLVTLSRLSRGVNVLNTVSDNWFKKVVFVGSLKRQLNDLATKVKPKTKADAEAYFNTFIKNKTFDDGKTKITSLEQYYGKLNVAGNPDAWKSIFREQDFNLENIMTNGNFHKVFGQSKEGRDAIQKATEDALYFTYQRAPDAELAKTFIKAVHAVPFLGTSFAPFPRFMVNAMRFTYEYSPTYLLLNKNARSEFAALVGNKSARELNDGYSNLAKGLLGTAFVLGATKFRMSEYAGDKWYLGKNEDGSTYDMRPFFPLAPYLYFGDLVARKLKGDPITAETNAALVRDTLQTVTGMQMFKTGFGLYSLETALSDLERGDTDRLAMTLSNFAANFIETFTIPATVPQDFYNSYFADADARILKDMEGPNAISVFLNKSFKRLPGNDVLYSQFEKVFDADSWAGKTFGIYEKPQPLTTAFRATDPITRDASVTRQYMGLMIRQRATEVEEEFTRLRISPNKFNKRTKNAKYNKLQNLISEAYSAGPLNQFIKSEEYNNMKASEIDLGDGTKKYYSKSMKQKLIIEHLIEEQYKPMRRTIMEDLQNDKEGADIIGRFNFDKGKRDLFKDLAYQTYHREIGVPKNDEYDYMLLNDIKKQFEKANITLD